MEISEILLKQKEICFSIIIITEMYVLCIHSKLRQIKRSLTFVKEKRLRKHCETREKELSSYNFEVRVLGRKS